MRPICFPLSLSTQKLRGNETAAKEENHSIKKDFEALAMIQVQARDGNIPAQGDQSAGKENKNAGNIHRATIAPSNRFVVKVHRAPPRQK